MSNTPCNVKILYDTEFEAERAASIAGYNFKSEMKHYPCGKHWHIANRMKINRSKQRSFNKGWCDICQTYMKPQNYERHITMRGHQSNQHKLKKEKE